MQSCSATAFYGCLNPSRVHNVYTGRLVDVNCGHCAYCLGIKQIELKNRVDREFKYRGQGAALFVTLTYDNDHLPIYKFDGRAKRWKSNREPKYNRYKYIPANKVERFSVPTGMPRDTRAFAHLCYPDVQAFFARIRQYAQHRDKKDGSYKRYAFRYFCCGEYGPATYRPHYHFILWPKAQDLGAQELNQLSEDVRKAWPLGLVDIQAVTSTDVGNYLSNYVSSRQGLPPHLQGREIRPFAHYSQCPVVGAFDLSETQILTAIDTGDAYRCRLDPDSRAYVVDELPASVRNRYFPLCQALNTQTAGRREYVYSYAWCYFKKGGVSHTPSEIDALALRDIHFPEYPLSASETAYYKALYHLEGKRSQLVSKDFRRRVWSRADKYASLQCYKYCVKFGRTPIEIMRAIIAVHARYYSRKFGRLVDYVNESTDPVAESVALLYRDPLGLAEASPEALASYPDNLDELLPVFEHLRDTHAANWQQRVNQGIKRKKVNEYKQGLKSSERSVTIIPNKYGCQVVWD